jgi:hypothetical protein
LNPELGDAWAERLKFISSESSFTSGGLIEGGLEAGLGYVQKIIGSEVFLKTDIAYCILHTASMD